VAIVIVPPRFGPAGAGVAVGAGAAVGSAGAGGAVVAVGSAAGPHDARKAVALAAERPNNVAVRMNSRRVQRPCR